MYDIPLHLNCIVLHPLTYVLFHSSYWHQTELEEEKLLEKIGHPCLLPFKLNAIKPFCFVFS